MSHIFISFAKEDTEFAHEVSAKIRSQLQTETWLYTEKLPSGAHWRTDIDEAIRECDAIVLIISPDSSVSIYVAYEWALGLGLGKYIIPILWKETEEFHPKLRLDIQYEDFRERQDWATFLRNLRDRVEAYTAFTIRVPRDAPKIIHTTVGRLDDPDLEVRQAAIHELSQLNHPSITAILIEALHFVAPDVRALAAEKLAIRDDPAVIPCLKTALQDPSPHVVEKVTKALGDLKALEAVDALIDYFHSAAMKRGFDGVHFVDLHHAIINALGEIGGETAFTFLCQTLKETYGTSNENSDSVQDYILYTLSRFGGRSVPVLAEAIQELPFDNLQQRIIRSLGDINDQKAVEELMKLAQGIDWKLSKYAIESLARADSDPAKTAFRELVSHEDRVPEQARSSLARPSRR